MKLLIIAAAVLGLSASAALAECAYHQKSANADTTQNNEASSESTVIVQ